MSEQYNNIAPAEAPDKAPDENMIKKLDRLLRDVIKHFRFWVNKKFFRGFGKFTEIMAFLSQKAKVPIESLPTQYILGKLASSKRLGTLEVNGETYYYATQGVALAHICYMRKWLEEKGVSEDTVFKPVTAVAWAGHMTSSDVAGKLGSGDNLITRDRAVHVVPVVKKDGIFLPDYSALPRRTDNKTRYEKVVIIDFAKLLEMQKTGVWKGFIWMNNARVIQITANIPNSILLTNTISFDDFWSKKDVTNY